MPPPRQVLAQVLKTAKFYDAKCRAGLPAFHSLLATHLAPSIKAASPSPAVAGLVSDWVCSFAASYIRGTGRSRKSLGGPDPPPRENLLITRPA